MRMPDVLPRRLRGLLADRRGNFMLEFALALPILFLLLVGLLDLGRFSLMKSALLQGAREGAQYGMIAPDDTTNIQTTAQNATGLTGATATSSTICECVYNTPVDCSSTCADSSKPKKYVQVITTASFRSVLKPATTSFGLNGGPGVGWAGSWTPPTTATATVTMIVP
jgi:Flp pilus assembly protein TadG